MSTIPIGSTDSARRAQAVIIVDRATGEPAAAGGGAGTSDTTEATQLGVLAAAEAIEAAGAKEAKQDAANTLLNDIAAATVATQAAVESTDPAPIVFDGASMRDGAAVLTPKYAVISASTSGDNTLVAAVTGKKIRVLAYNFIAAGAVNARFQSGASGSYLTGLKTIDAASKGLCAPFNPVGWFETASAALLNLELSGAVLVGGELVYVEV